MPITPEAAGYRRGLTLKEQNLVHDICEKFDCELKERYEHEPTATGVYVDCPPLDPHVRSAIQAAYENVGWVIRYDHRGNEDYIVFIPKDQSHWHDSTHSHCHPGIPSRLPNRDVGCYWYVGPEVHLVLDSGDLPGRQEHRRRQVMARFPPPPPDEPGVTFKTPSVQAESSRKPPAWCWQGTSTSFRQPRVTSQR